MPARSEPLRRLLRRCRTASDDRRHRFSNLSGFRDPLTKSGQLGKCEIRLPLGKLIRSLVTVRRSPALVRENDAVLDLGERCGKRWNVVHRWSLPEVFDDLVARSA
jgi:hypothetical protein